MNKPTYAQLMDKREAVLGQINSLRLLGRVNDARALMNDLDTICRDLDYFYNAERVLI
jgi:hypothetical protein